MLSEASNRKIAATRPSTHRQITTKMKAKCTPLTPEPFFVISDVLEPVSDVPQEF
jgi:hypothetical protein